MQTVEHVNKDGTISFLTGPAPWRIHDETDPDYKRYLANEKKLLAASIRRMDQKLKGKVPKPATVKPPYQGCIYTNRLRFSDTTGDPHLKLSPVCMTITTTVAADGKRTKVMTIDGESIKCEYPAPKIDSKPQAEEFVLGTVTVS